jgi:hypothetical protein
MNRCSDFIMTEGGQRVGHHLHRVSIIDNTCAPEGGELHQPPLARPARVGRSRVFRDDDDPLALGWWLLIALDIVAAAALLVIVVAK